MIVKLLQSCICLALSPLIVAQQVQQGAAPATTNRPGGAAEALSSSPDLTAVPDNTKIKLGRSTAATGTPGDSIRLAVASDVVVDGVVRVPAGTLINGIVSDEKRGSHKLDRGGRVTVRARDLKSGRALKVRMAGTGSEQRDYGFGGDRVTHTLEIAGLITAALLVVALTSMQ